METAESDFNPLDADRKKIIFKLPFVSIKPLSVSEMPKKNQNA
ncbi:hypothetical protein [Flavobacterium noncentrifugens]|nr:hypothetical protein [Flavobacterium noncentrifugens]